MTLAAEQIIVMPFTLYHLSRIYLRPPSAVHDCMYGQHDINHQAYISLSQRIFRNSKLNVKLQYRLNAQRIFSSDSGQPWTATPLQHLSTTGP